MLILTHIESTRIAVNKQVVGRYADLSQDSEGCLCSLLVLMLRVHGGNVLVIYGRGGGRERERERERVSERIVKKDTE